MDEQALRELVRQAVARHLHGADAHDGGAVRPLVLTSHASHYRYVLPESDGPCLIEPTVRCNHCGYCQSHGH
ncbi:MAG TPA: hypothetical protein VFJ02_00310 [Vicinamibacterales bacterium]|nr:hypothetical protein [Vicinamibacterales bacterium]